MYYPEHPHPVEFGRERRRGNLPTTNTREDAPKAAVLVHVEQALRRVD